MIDDVDLAIVGGGSAAFAAALRASELGASAALVEAGTLGGTCVNVGCVPSKTLIRAAEVAHRARSSPFRGVETAVTAIDFPSVLAQKDELVGGLRQAKYWDVLAGHPSILLLRGRATLRPDGTVDVGGEPLRARKILLATGASPWIAPIPGLDPARVLTSADAMALDRLPRTIAVIGGGFVGLELAQVFARLGAKVTVVARSRLLSAEDEDVSDGLAAYLRDEGLEVLTGAAVERVRHEPGGHLVEVARGGARRVVEAEQILVATGRRPNTDGMGLGEAGVARGPLGEILVDDHLRTTRPGVYAAGDVTGGPMLVYVAARDGGLAAENALRGDTRARDLDVVPRVTFTDPAVASVGLTQAQARERGVPLAVSKLPLAQVPRALAARDTRGLIKLLADESTNRLVGAHVLAPDAGETIQAAAMAIQFDIPVDRIASMLHPYLTHAEGIKLACQGFSKNVSELSCCAA